MNELAIPDPRKQPVPVGWFENEAVPAILEASDWDSLDEYEARLRAFASYIESFDGDVLEFEKALRVIEKRRGDLLGPREPGKRTDLQPPPRVAEESEGSKQRWRMIARHWDDLWPFVVEAKDRRDVTQSALLRRAKRFERPYFGDPVAIDGSFPVLYCDPPWRYEHMATPDLRAVENHYPTLLLDEIKSLEVPAADDAVLFLWATNPKLADALEVVAAWGFEYRTCMAWVKDRIGMGYYVRQQHELLLIARRGGFPVPAEEDRPASVVQAPRGRHSAKPPVFYDLIERMYPGYSRVELFARNERPGWVSWGNEVAVAA